MLSFNLSKVSVLVENCNFSIQLNGLLQGNSHVYFDR